MMTALIAPGATGAVVQQRPCPVPGCIHTVPTATGMMICRWCLADLTQDLTDLWTGPEIRRWEREPGLIEDLIDVMARLKRSGLATGVASRSASKPLPYDEAASSLLWTVRNTLTEWSADVYRRFGGETPHGASPVLAEYLAVRPIQLARYPDVVSMRDEIRWLTEEVRRTVDIAPVRVYLGVCGAQPADKPTCREQLYVPPGHATARCRGCGAVYDVSVRRGQLLEQAQDHIAPAGEICRALGLLDMPLSVRRLRVWAHRGLLTQYDPHPWDPMHRPRYRLGDVVTLLLANSGQKTGATHLDARRAG